MARESDVRFPPIADVASLMHCYPMEEQQDDLDRMTAAEGSAAAEGLARLLQHLLKVGVVDEEFVSGIRDDMLLGLDPSVAPATDRGLQLAYRNTLVRFNFLSTEPRDLIEPGWEGAEALRRLMAGK